MPALANKSNPVVLVLLLLLLLIPAVAFAHDVYVYRGVNANANSGIASVSPGQFNFNEELSTFDTVDSAPVAKPCLFRFTVTGVAHNPAQVGDTGTIAGLPGFVVTYDNNPAHHWSIARPHALSALEARGVVSVFAGGHRAIVNGTQDNCQ